jgi:hypothetical protein
VVIQGFEEWLKARKAKPLVGTPAQ